MNDSYAELLIKKKPTQKDILIKGAALLVTVGLLALGFIVNWILFVPGIFLMFADYAVLPLLDLEYEYLYVGGEMSIDKIVGKTMRKSCFTAEMEQIELIAPKGSDRIAEWNHTMLVEKDFTSGRNDRTIYICILHNGKELWKVLFEPDDKMLQLMRASNPRKIVLEG